MARKAEANGVADAIAKWGLTQIAAWAGVRERTVERWRDRGGITDLPAAAKIAKQTGWPIERFVPPEEK